MDKPIIFNREFRETLSATMTKDEIINCINNYCDGLEKYCRDLQFMNDVYKSTIKDLERAINKGCEELALSNKQLVDLDRRYLPMSKEDWKQILMKGILDE